MIDNCKRNIVNTSSNYYDIFGMRRSVNEGVLFRALEKQKECGKKMAKESMRKKTEGGKLIKNKTILANNNKKNEHKRTFESQPQTTTNTGYSNNTLINNSKMQTNTPAGSTLNNIVEEGNFIIQNSYQQS